MPALAPYIPVKDADLDAWLANFAALVAASPPLYGLTTVEAGLVSGVVLDWHNAYVPVTSPSTRTRALVGAKNDAKVIVLAVTRPIAQEVALNPGVASSDKIALGLNPRTSLPSPISPPDTNPVLTVQSAGPLSMIVRYRDSEASVKVKSKPYGVTRIRLFVGLSSTIALRSPVPSGLKFFGDFTKSPISLLFDESAGGMAATMAAQWVIRTGGVSPFSPLVSFTVPASG
jgi:hypothetical protein